jgi:hypothetical protein
MLGQQHEEVTPGRRTTYDAQSKSITEKTATTTINSTADTSN